MEASGQRASRVDIGFAGGQVLAVRLLDDAYEALRRALESPETSPWHQVETEDSNVSVDVRQVVYLRLDTERQRVGF